MVHHSGNMKQGNIIIKKAPVKIQSKISIEKTAFFEKSLFLVILILILTFIAFYPSLTNDFIRTWDDDQYVISNQSIQNLNQSSLKEIFITPVNGSYEPLPMLTFAAEYKIFGLNPFIFHLSNLLLHLLCTLLVFQILRLLKLNPLYAAIGAIIFGVHPMHVESVAWIAERKELLYSLFFLTSIIAYINYLNSQKNKLVLFLLSLFLFILALFSKITAVTLPLSLLLIDYYLERPFQSKVFIEKIPFFIFSLAFGIAEIIMFQRQNIFHATEMISIPDQIFLGFYALSVYIIKFFLPLKLSAIYPWLNAPGHALPYPDYISPLFILLLGFLIYLATRKNRAILFGSLFFLVNIILMFQIQILTQGIGLLADRFTYIPYIGLLFIVVWTIEKLVKNKKSIKYIPVLFMAIVITVFITQTFNRCKIWANGVTLWSDVIKKYPDEIITQYYYRSIEYGYLRQPEKAIDDCTRAIELKSDYKEAYYNRGNEYENLKQWDKAIADYTKAIEIDPDYETAYSNRGNSYGNLGQWNKAKADYSKAIEIDPGYKVAYVNLGAAYGNLGQWDKAIAEYSKAIGLDPDYKEVYLDRGFAFGRLGQPDKALDDYSKAIEIDPNNKESYFTRGNEYLNLKQWDKAISDYTKAIGIDPGYEAAYSNRGIAYGNLKQWDKAIEDFTKATEINPDNETSYSNRGFAYGNLQQWDKAISDYSKALALNPNFTIAYNNREIAYKNLKKQ